VGEPPVLWEPRPEGRGSTRLGAFLDAAEVAAGRDLEGFDDLLAWSVAELGPFWSLVAAHHGVHWHDEPTAALVDGHRLPGATWFPGGTLSYAEHALSQAAQTPDEVAVVGRSQTRVGVELTWGELLDAVRRCRAGLVRLGVGRNDRVAAYLPNVPETIVAFLATASLGAVWTSCAPEFGTRSVVDRLSQIEPKVLLAVDGYRYGAKDVDRTREVAEIRAALPGLGATVWLPYLDSSRPLPAALAWDDLVAPTSDPLTFEPVPFTHPLYLLFSSGTTGLPKPIVHGHGGILVEHLKALALHHDLGPGRRFTWFTTTGWMMWNYLVSGLCVGATIITFDGDPGSPDLGTLWRLVGETRCDVFGASAPFLLACRKAGMRPRELADLSHLSQVGSTGAPLPAEGFRWVYDELGPDVLLSSVSGGTDVCTPFVGMNPLTPVWEGEISRPMLGVAVAAFDPAGNPVVGELGELVVTAPMPSMPVGFWGDDDGSRFRAAYFEDFPGVWRHGDWVTFTDRGTCTITGRSDATLNRGGVRLGTADFYSVVEALPEIADSLVVHLEADDRLLLFVALAEGATLDDDLRRRLCAALRSELSPRHVPDRIEAVPVIPRTLSGKKLEVPVKRILQGTPPDQAAARGALADPTSLDPFTAF
jgi:acetoacetyl-CoA synthetase